MRLPVLLLSAVVPAACSSYDPPRVVAAPATKLQAAVATFAVTAEDGIFLGAGDIARCSQLANAMATGDIIRAVLAGNPRAVVFTAGDNAYEDGTPLEFTNCYDKAWGSFNASTTPAPGNHDYHTTAASGHFNYFDYYRVNPAAKARTYYSFDLASWHIVSLNSNIPMAAGSAQVAWLNGDLEETSKPCILSLGPRGEGLPWDSAMDRAIFNDAPSSVKRAGCLLPEAGTARLRSAGRAGCIVASVAVSRRVHFATRRKAVHWRQPAPLRVGHVGRGRAAEAIDVGRTIARRT